MLNWTDSFSDITTFAHEMGHAIHSTLSSQNQNALQCDYSMSLAETASTFCEDFAWDEVVQTLSPEEKLIAYAQKLDDTIATIFRQVACYKFELEIHKQYRQSNHLSKQDIGQIFIANMQNYM
jgi:oligoendopeptidase F